MLDLQAAVNGLYMTFCGFTKTTDFVSNPHASPRGGTYILDPGDINYIISPSQAKQEVCCIVDVCETY